MKRILSLLYALALLTACQQTIEVSAPKEEPLGLIPKATELTITNLPQATIGRKIPNPLCLEIVRNAFNLLDPATKSGYVEDDILPTHHYVAFTPSNDEELAAVQSIDEEQIIIHYFPLDYEVSDGIITPDERFMTNGYSYYWAYVPIGYDISSIHCPYIMYYDIVALDNDLAVTKSNSKLSAYVTDALLKKAYSLCGIELNPIIQTKNDVHPSGYVKFYDTDYNSFRAVNGFKVRAIRGLHQCWMNCDANGYFYSSDTFKNAFQYEFMFRRDYFEVRKGEDNNFAIIKLSGQSGPVNVNFADDESCFMATIVRAATRYYYEDINGLRRPPIPAGSLYRPYFKAILGASNNLIDQGQFKLKYFTSLYQQPELYIYRENGSGVRTNQSVYETTIHELAHTSMWFNNDNYDYTDVFVTESFAKGIAWAITSLEYNDVEYSPKYFRRSYTGIVQDLVDPVNITKECNNIVEKDEDGRWVFTVNNKTYTDYVSGISLADIETAARTSRNIEEWQEAIIEMYPEKTAQILNAFNFWKY